MKTSVCMIGMVLLLMGPLAGVASERERPLFELDGASFVTFYDLPSRRFRTIREAFIARDFESCARDLTVTAHYLEIEAQRTHEVLREPLAKAIADLRSLAASVEEPSVGIQAFTPLFARVHWLLSQHFLIAAVESRDGQRYKETSNYLVAAAHHMERAVLWSNYRINPPLEKGLDQLRTLATRLAANPNRKWVEENRPVVTGARLLRDIGKHLNRTVLVDESLQD